MAAGGIVGGIPRGGLASGDQRALGRRAYRSRAGFSPGGMSVQDDEVGAMLKYLADVGRTGEGTPRARGFAGIQRR